MREYLISFTDYFSLYRFAYYYHFDFLSYTRKYIKEMTILIFIDNCPGYDIFWMAWF